MTFKEKSLQVRLSNGQIVLKPIILPTITLQADASAIPNELVTKLRTNMPTKIGGIDIVRSSMRATHIPVRDKRIDMAGVVKIEKWWKTNGFDCRWRGKLIGGYLRCERREWKGRLFEKTLQWNGSIVFDLEEKVPQTPADKLIYSSANNNIEEKTKTVVLDAKGTVKKISNDLESFFIDLLGWFSSAFNGSFDNWNVSSKLGFNSEVSPEVVDSREELYPQEKSFVYYEKEGFVRREGGRGLWQIFVDTLKFDEKVSGFERDKAGRILMNLAYTMDNRAFNKKLSDNNGGKGFDPFTKPFFCAGDKIRKRVEEYVEKIAGQLEAVTPPETFLGTREELARRAQELFGNSDGASYLIRRGYVRPIGKGRYSGTVPKVDVLRTRPGPILAWDSVDTFSSYFDLGLRERRCLVELANARRGSLERIYPFDDFEICLQGRSITLIQKQILTEIRRRISPQDLFEVSVFRPPVRNAKYRGWYYCYRNTRLCAGKDNIYWWQLPSKYGSRGNRHGGLDLIGDDYLGSTKIYAIANGRLSFSAKDKFGWGNALVLPFRIGGVEHFAIYAHLPDDSRYKHNQRVTGGQSMGTTGCTGNSGDGRGNCNTYCEWAGQKRTDEHLHFEVVKLTNGKFEKLDPVSILNLKIHFKNRRFRAPCKRGDRRIARG